LGADGWELVAKYFVLNEGNSLIFNVGCHKKCMKYHTLDFKF